MSESNKREYLVKSGGTTTAYVFSKQWIRFVDDYVPEESDDKKTWSKVEISWETYE